LRAALFGLNPGAVLPGRIVPHVASVAAFQVGDPVTLLVLMKTYNCPLQGEY